MLHPSRIEHSAIGIPSIKLHHQGLVEMHSAGLHRVSRKSSGLSKMSSTPPSSAASHQRPPQPPSSSGCIQFACHSIDELLAANIGELHPKLRPWTTTVAEGRPPRHTGKAASQAQPHPPVPSADPLVSTVSDTVVERPQAQKFSPPRPSTTVSEVSRMRQLLRDVIATPQQASNAASTNGFAADVALIDEDYDTFISNHRSVLPESLSMQLLLAQELAKDASRKVTSPENTNYQGVPPAPPVDTMAWHGARSARSSRLGTAGSHSLWTPNGTLAKRAVRSADETLGTDADLETLRAASQESLTRLLQLVLQALLEPRRAVNGVLTPRETCVPSAMLDLMSASFKSATAPLLQKTNVSSSQHNASTKPLMGLGESRSPRLVPDHTSASNLPKLGNNSIRRGQPDPIEQQPHEKPTSSTRTEDDAPQLVSPRGGAASEQLYCKALLKRIDALQQDKTFLQEEVSLLQKDLTDARNDLARMSERYFVAYQQSGARPTGM